MKKVFCCLITIVLCISFSACNSHRSNMTNEHSDEKITSVSHSTTENRVCLYEGCASYKSENSQYCVVHTCKIDDCYNVRTKNSPLYGFCELHECSVQDCPYEKWNSLEQCRPHTCYFENCKNLKALEDIYCSKHGGQTIAPQYDVTKVCQVDNCSNSRSSKYFCKSHTCAIADCPHAKENNEKYCTRHGSEIAAKEEYENATKCAISGCGWLPEDGSKYCVMHKCHNDYCAKQRCSSEGYFCVDHKCAVSDCEAEKTHGNYCVYHNGVIERNTCTVDGCNNIKSPPGDYCEKHKAEFDCQYQNCSYATVNNSKYCSIHICSYNGCKNGKGLSNYYCNEHSCKATNIMNECSNSAVAGYNLCSSHKCNKSGCPLQKEMGSNYCRGHK